MIMIFIQIILLIRKSTRNPKTNLLMGSLIGLLVVATITNSELPLLFRYAYFAFSLGLYGASLLQERSGKNHHFFLSKKQFKFIVEYQIKEEI